MASDRTHCKYGHEFKPGNFRLVQQKNSGIWYRQCAVCPRSYTLRLLQGPPVLAYSFQPFTWIA